MAYVRTKKVRGEEYYQLVEGRRENGKVKQRVLCHLGQYPSVDIALERIPFLIKIAPYPGRSFGEHKRGEVYTPYKHDRLLEYSHERQWMYKEAASGFLQKKLSLLRSIRGQGKGVGADSVVPTEDPPAGPGDSPTNGVVDDELLRKEIKRLRAKARRRHRKVDDVTVRAHMQGYTLTDEDWGKLGELLDQAEVLQERAYELAQELERRKLAAKD